MTRYNYLELGSVVEHLPWYWRFIATCSSWFFLVGFIIFPFAVEPETTTLNANKNALIGTSVIVLTIAYLLSSLFYVRWRRSNFLSESLFLPCFTSCLLGMFNVVINICIRQLRPLGALSITMVTVGAISTAAYGIATIYYDNSLLIPGCCGGRRHNRSTAVNLDDEELQRRQFLGLYRQRGDRAPSQEISKATFRIDLPDPTTRGIGHELVVTPPQNAYERSLPSATTPPSHYDPYSARPARAPLNGSYKFNPMKYWHTQRTNTKRPLAELIS